MTFRSQQKKSNQLSLSLIPSEMIAKLERIQNTARESKHLAINPHKQWEQQQTINKQQQNHRHRLDRSRSHCLGGDGGGGLN